MAIKKQTTKKKQSASSVQQVIETFHETLLPQKKNTALAYHTDKSQLRVFTLADSALATKNLVYFPLYTKGELIGAPPKSIQPFLTAPRPVLHATYAYNKIKRGSVVYYEADMSLEELIALAKQEKKILDVRVVEKNKVTKLSAPRKIFHSLDATIDKNYNIRMQFAAHPSLFEILPAIPRQDIMEHCGTKPAKELQTIPAHLTRVATILPERRLFSITPSDKALNRAGKGDYYDICPIVRGTDTSTGCVVNRRPSGLYDASLTCDFCYAKRLAANPYANSVFAFSSDRFKQVFLDGLVQDGHDKKKIVHHRIGQTTEAMVPQEVSALPDFVPGLDNILDALIEINKEGERIVRTSLITKMPTSSPVLIQKLLDANVAVGVSLGYETYGLENGARMWGFTTEHRLDAAYHLAQEGVPTFLFVMTDISRPHNALQQDAQMALDFFHKHKQVNLPFYFQFLEARITKESLAPIMGGATWNELKQPFQKPFTYSVDLFSKQSVIKGNVHGGRFDYHKNALVQKFMHDDFSNLIANNRGDIRMCYTYGPSDKQKCGLCFTDKLSL